jgi:Papain-like cysteine protease AvrRpt2
MSTVLERSRSDVRASWPRWLVDLFGSVSKPRWRRLPLNVQAQLQSQWCWAACSTSVSHFFDAASAWTQCGVVNAELSQTGCCEDGSTATCNQPWYLDKALTRTGNFASRTSGTAPMSKIRSELSAGRPVGVRIGWTGGGGHFVTISGCLDDATGMLEIRDSIYGTSDISLANFTSSYQGSGSWTHTYFTRA